MKNRPFYILVAVVSSVIALLIFWLYLSAVGGALPENAIGGLCTILFLIVAVIAYELVTKPGLYSRRAERNHDEEEEDRIEGEDTGGSP